MDRTVIVCGDSYMSPVVNHPGRHFSELVAKELDLNLVAYSRAGMSNGGIALQIESAIKAKPSLILLGFSFFDRIEYPVTYDDGTEDLDVHSILYNDQHSLSTHSGMGQRPKLVSTNLHELLDPTAKATWPHNFSDIQRAEEKQQIIIDWFHNIYFSSWKRKLDEHLIYSVLHQLHRSGIRYVLCFDFIAASAACNWLDDDHNIWPIMPSILNSCGNLMDPGFHTTYEAQEQIRDLLLPRCRRLLRS